MKDKRSNDTASGVVKDKAHQRTIHRGKLTTNKYRSLLLFRNIVIWQVVQSIPMATGKHPGLEISAQFCTKEMKRSKHYGMVSIENSTASCQEDIRLRQLFDDNYFVSVGFLMFYWNQQ